MGPSLTRRTQFMLIIVYSPASCHCTLGGAGSSFGSARLEICSASVGCFNFDSLTMQGLLKGDDMSSILFTHSPHTV